MNGRDIARFGRYGGVHLRGPGKGFLSDPGRTAVLGTDELAEFFQAFSILHQVAYAGSGLVFVRCLAAQDEHLAADGFNDFHEPAATLSRQGLYGFIDFQAVADSRSQGSFHGSQNSPRRPAGQSADIDHGPCQLAGPFFCLHERSVTVFDIEDDGVGSGGDFLAHDGAGNERNAFDGRRRIAQGIEQFICRSDFTGLADNGHSHVPHLLEEGIF